MNLIDATSLALQALHIPSINLSAVADAVEDTPLALKHKLLDPSYLNSLLVNKEETIIELGVREDGTSMELDEEQYSDLKSSLIKTLDAIDVECNIIWERSTLLLRGEASATQFRYAHLLLRRRPQALESLSELRVCVVGNVDAGKSTLLGVLTKNVLDDGRGKTRLGLFRFKHEIESGRTSSVGTEVLGFDAKGKIVAGGMKVGMDQVYKASAKIVTFLDLAGHEKYVQTDSRYLKTTVFGMTGCAPDYVMLMVAANAGIIGMTKEHLGLALALQVPVFIVITKVDMTPNQILASTILQLSKILKSSGCRKIPMFIESVPEVIVAAETFISERICPIFQVSNVTGLGLDNLRLFLNLLNTENALDKYSKSGHTEFQISDHFSVAGVGTIVSGTVTSGKICVGDTLYLGPDSLGDFTPTTIKSIHRKRVPVISASAGHSASFALKRVKRASVRKGMLMLDLASKPAAYYEFEAEVLVLFHSTTIRLHYQAMLHCEGVRQTAQIIGMDKEILRTGDRAIVRFRFLQTKEFVKVGANVLFREGRTKGVGRIVSIGPKSE